LFISKSCIYWHELMFLGGLFLYDLL
jgi:hypothetical protein